MIKRSDEFVRLKEISGWNQARIARELDLDPSTVSLVMNHRCQPSLTVLRLFALLIGERLQMPGESDGVSYLRDRARWLEDWEAELIGNFRRLDPSVRVVAAKAVGTLIDSLAHPTRYRVRGGKESSGDAGSPITADDIALTEVAAIVTAREQPPSGGSSAPSSRSRKPRASGSPAPLPSTPETKLPDRTDEKSDSKRTRDA